MLYPSQFKIKKLSSPKAFNRHCVPLKRYKGRCNTQRRFSKFRLFHGDQKVQGVTHPLPLPTSATAKPCVNNISQTVSWFSLFLLPFKELTWFTFSSILAVQPFCFQGRQKNSSLFFHQFSQAIWILLLQ